MAKRKISEKVLTIDETKTYGFNLSGNSTFEQYYKIQKEFDRIRQEHIKTLMAWYEKQDREVLKKCLMKEI
jgi:hypothetical protein